MKEICGQFSLLEQMIFKIPLTRGHNMNRELKIQALGLLNEQKISLHVFQCLFIDRMYFVYKDDSVLVGQLTTENFLERTGDEVELSIEDYRPLQN